MKNYLEKLRPYQIDALQAIEKAFEFNNHVVLAACPGSGKTKMTVEYMVNIHPEYNYLVLTHGTNVIKDQWSEVFESEGIEASDKFDPNNPSRILYGLPHGGKEFKKQGTIDILVIDEAHEFTFAKMTQDLIETLKPKKILYLTGTPSKFILANQRKDFNIKYDIITVAGEKVIEEGFISDLYFGMCSTSLELHESDYNINEDLTCESEKQLTQYVNDDLNKLVFEIHKRLSVTIFKDNPGAYKLSKKITPKSLSKSLSFIFNNLDKTMFACKSIAQAELVHQYFLDKGIKAVMSTSDNDINSDMIQKFKKDQDVKVLIVVFRGILGFNMPELVNVVDMTYSRNIDRIYQLYARVMRKSGDKLKYFFKLAPSEQASLHKFYMEAALCMLKEEFITKFNGKNLNDRKILVLKPRKEFEHSKTDKKKINNKSMHQPIEQLFYNEVTALRLMKDLESSAGDTFSEYAYTTLNIIRNERLGSNITWTDEMIRVEALKYTSRYEFYKESSSAYQIAYKKGKEFLDDICSHMEIKYIKWTDEMIRVEALKYTSRYEFQKESSSAYKIAHKKGKEFLDDICSHMKGNITWTDEMLRVEALKYTSRGEFYKGSPGAYQIAYKKGKEFLDDICSHMEIKHIKWTDETLRVEALKYTSRYEFQKESGSAYKIAHKKGKEFLDDICSHMEIKYIKWTIELLKEEALKYTSRGEFQKESSSAYQIAREKGKEFLDDICSHMKKKNEK